MAEHAATLASETLSLASMEEKLKRSEARRAEAEDNAVRAAIAGKELLEKNSELSKVLQQERQRRDDAILSYIDIKNVEVYVLINHQVLYMTLLALALVIQLHTVEHLFTYLQK